MKVFISYAWTNNEYTSKILLLAERLMSDGVETIIDKWDLSAGQDKYAFMEQMIQDSSIDHVLIMLNREYKQKSDERKGGVGTEAQIISSDLYNKVDQTKFIPIVIEKDDSGRPYLPIYLNNRIYIDLSENENYEYRYEELLRLIYKRPQFQKPKLGTAPLWIFEDKENISNINIKERELITSLEKNHKSRIIKVRDYIEIIQSELINAEINEKYHGQHDFGKVALDSFTAMTPVKNSLLNVLKNIAIYDESIETFDEFFQFFRNIEKFYRPNTNKDNSSWTLGQYDNYALFFYELIISSMAILLKFNRYNLANKFLSNVLIKDNATNWMYGGLEKNIETIYDKFESLHIIPEYFQSITGKSFLQPVVEILKNRVFPSLSFSDIIEADLVLHYYRAFTSQYNQYFPRFTVYLGECKLTFLINLIYKDKSKSVLTVFGIDNLNLLKEKIDNGYFLYDKLYTDYYNRIPKLTSLIDQKLWGTK